MGTPQSSSKQTHIQVAKAVSYGITFRWLNFTKKGGKTYSAKPGSQGDGRTDEYLPTCSGSLSRRLRVESRLPNPGLMFLGIHLTPGSRSQTCPGVSSTARWWGCHHRPTPSAPSTRRQPPKNHSVLGEQPQADSASAPCGPLPFQTTCFLFQFKKSLLVLLVFVLILVLVLVFA